MANELKTNPVLIAIGANIDPEDNIRIALKLLRTHMPVSAISTFYYTRAVGAPDQPTFINGACKVETKMMPQQLKSILRDIERKVGRVRTADKYAAREIDLDIALYGDHTVDELDLRIPDPDIPHRPFLAVPLAELAPNWFVPGAGATLQELAARQSKDGLEPVTTLTEVLKKEFPGESATS